MTDFVAQPLEDGTTFATEERPTPELVAGALETAVTVAGRPTWPADVSGLGRMETGHPAERGEALAEVRASVGEATA